MKRPTTLPKTMVSRRILTSDASGLNGEELIRLHIGIPQHGHLNRR